MFLSEPDTIVLDLETTVQQVEDKTDNSPYNPANRCVSAHWRMIDSLGQIGPEQFSIYYHNEVEQADDKEILQAALRQAKTIVCHNAKFDTSWLLAMGFEIPGRVYCTMIGEYIFARGQWQKLSLQKIAIRRSVTHKKTDVTDTYFKKGIGFEAMPLAEMVDYANTDVLATAEIYLQHLDELEQEKNRGLKPVFDLMHDMLLFLVEIEKNGCWIDQNALDEVELQFRQEKDEIEKRLQEIVEIVMGDTPINLASGIDLCKVIYSRRVKDRDLHIQMFNIGTQANGKKKHRPRMKDHQFRAAVRATTEVVRKTVIHCCPDCEGRGHFYKVKKDGNLYKNPTKCPVCNGEGVVYLPTGQTAGLKLSPTGPEVASIHGFSAGKDVIKILIHQAREKGNDLAVEFLTKMSRLNAISTYLDSFVHGISMWTRGDGILHPNFNQTVAKTGRLSSTQPNFQNLPKGKKFPVRKVIKSRWKDGLILEGDFSQLEFRVAGILSGDEQIFKDVLNGKDVHRQTASIVHQKAPEEVEKDERDSVKPHCVPLDSEILTRDGWKFYNQVDVGEEVLTYSQEKGVCEWQPMLEKCFFETAAVVEFGHSHWKVRATPNHRWYGWRRAEGPGGTRYSKSCVFTTDEITSEHNITTSAFCGDEGAIPMSLEDICVLTWIVTDGTYRHSAFTGRTSQKADGSSRGCSAYIIQKKEIHCTSIEHFLTGVGATKTVDVNGTNRWYLPASYFRSLWEKSGLDHENPDWVRFVTHLSPEQRRVFIDTFYKAEGTPRKNGERRFSQNEGSLMDGLRLALHLDGKDTRVTGRISYTGKTHQIITERKKSHVTAQRFKTYTLSKEAVWCPRTPNQTWVMRQGKIITILGNTFAPLYGGQGGFEPPHVKRYYEEFFNVYSGVGRWHQRLMEGVLRSGIVKNPSGREYYWPDARRTRNGRITNATQVVNYPVQGFATGDLVPLACVRALAEFRRRGLKSLLILTVHDSIVVDVYPGELDQVVEALVQAMELHDAVKELWDYELTLPLAIEIEAGTSWMDMETIDISAYRAAA